MHPLSPKEDDSHVFRDDSHMIMDQPPPSLLRVTAFIAARANAVAQKLLTRAPALQSLGLSCLDQDVSQGRLSALPPKIEQIKKEQEKESQTGCVSRKDSSRILLKKEEKNKQGVSHKDTSRFLLTHTRVYTHKD